MAKATTLSTPKIRALELTTDEMALIKQLCLPNKIISQRMGIAVPAVKMRIARLAAKFGAETRTAIIVKALALGLVAYSDMVYRERHD
jgi:DNA-binding CsgD family transcriptional regulator